MTNRCKSMHYLSLSCLLSHLTIFHCHKFVLRLGSEELAFSPKKIIIMPYMFTVNTYSMKYDCISPSLLPSTNPSDSSLIPYKIYESINAYG